MGSAIIKKNVQDTLEAIEHPDQSDIAFVTRKISVDSVISTGSTLLDLSISGKRRRGGGIPGGYIAEIFGRASSGKTALMAEVGASTQSLGGSLHVLDPEARLDKEYSRIYGLSINKDNYGRPDTVEAVFDFIKGWRPPDPSKINVIGVDSLAALSTELEMSPKGDKMGMKRAKEFSTGFRVTGRQLASNNWLMFCTNQVRQGEYGEVTPGGNAVSFWASLRIRVNQEELVYKEVTLDSGAKVKKAIGIRSSCFIKKSSIDDPFRECDIYIIFGYGIDDIRGNLQYLKDMMNMSKYPCPDGREYGPINMAIKHIEDYQLKDALREKTIDLWEEIESKFSTNRRKER